MRRPIRSVVIVFKPRRDGGRRIAAFRPSTGAKSARDAKLTVGATAVRS